MNQYTAILKEEDGCWIGWIEEVPGVNCQEATREDLMESLKEVLKEAIEMNRQDAAAAASGGFEKAILRL